MILLERRKCLNRRFGCLSGRLESRLNEKNRAENQIPNFTTQQRARSVDTRFMRTLTNSQTIEPYDGILRGVALLEKQAKKCEFRAQLMLVSVPVLTLLAGMMLTHNMPFVALLAIGGFLFGWNVAQGIWNKASMIRLQAELALAQRDVAVNSSAALATRREAA